MESFLHYTRRYGLPQSVYVDRHTTYLYPKSLPLMADREIFEIRKACTAICIEFRTFCDIAIRKSLGINFIFGVHHRSFGESGPLFLPAFLVYPLFGLYSHKDCFLISSPSPAKSCSVQLNEPL